MRRYRRPQQIDPQAVSQIEFPELAAMVIELRRRRDLRQLVDVVARARAVAESWGYPTGTGATESGGCPMGTSSKLDIQDWRVTILGDSTCFWMTSRRQGAVAKLLQDEVNLAQTIVDLGACTIEAGRVSRVVEIPARTGWRVSQGCTPSKIGQGRADISI